MKYRTLFISDIHLGSSKARTQDFLEFIKNNSFEQIYLVGDIIDIWQLKRKKYWPQLHTDAIRKLLKRSKYCKMYYIIGNHDEFLLNFTEEINQFGNIYFCEEIIHTTINNKKLLVIHGHQFDGVTKYAPIVAYLGDCGYEFLVMLTKWYHYFCRKFGWEYRSLSAFAKSKVKQAVNFISNYEESLTHYAITHKTDGVITGHIHHPDIKKINEIEYYNCGDWIDSCSAIVEDFDGNLILLNKCYRN